MSSILPFDNSTVETVYIFSDPVIFSFTANETVALAELSGCQTGRIDSESSLPILRGVNVVFS